MYRPRTVDVVAGFLLCCVVSVITFVCLHCDCLHAGWRSLVAVAFRKSFGGEFCTSQGQWRLQHLHLFALRLSSRSTLVALQLSSCLGGAILNVAARRWRCRTLHAWWCWSHCCSLGQVAGAVAALCCVVVVITFFWLAWGLCRFGVSFQHHCCVEPVIMILAGV